MRYKEYIDNLKETIDKNINRNFKNYQTKWRDNE